MNKSILSMGLIVMLSGIALGSVYKISDIGNVFPATEFRGDVDMMGNSVINGTDINATRANLDEAVIVQATIDEFLGDVDMMGNSVVNGTDINATRANLDDLSVINNVVVGTNATITDEVTARVLNAKNYVAQYHQTAQVVTANTDWNNLSWNMRVGSETYDDYISSVDSNESFLFLSDGVYRVQGCVHINSTVSDATVAKVYVRTIIDGVEARCLQASQTKNFRAADMDTLTFVGTIAINANSRVRLQYKVSNTGINFAGDTAFDNPVTFSVNFERISDSIT